MRKKLTILFALLCASMMGFAGQFCNTLLTADNAASPAGDCWNDGVYFTASKTGPLETTFTITSTKRILTGNIFNGQALMQIPGGGTLDGDFASGWTLAGNTLTKVAKWKDYPTSNIQVYIVVEVSGDPNITGAQIPNLDVSSACGGGGDPTPTPDPEPEPEGTTFNIHEVWPTDRVTAVKNGDNFDVHIATYGGNQWQAQVKLLHNIDFAATKSYKVAFDLTADQDCGGITFKTDNNTGSVYEYPINGLVASIPYHYEKVFSGQAGNDKIMVFDFGLVGNNTNITISNLTLVEYSPATASSTNGDLIPFKAVDGNTGTRWQAASKGEAWWKMDYGTSQSFNRVNITWENSYAKSFTIQGSNDDESYTTLATVSGQTISTFPYKQVIDLDQLYNYRYVKFVGTENGNDYGFSFYEFEIMEVETSVLTSVVITSPRRKTVCPISSSIDITAEARDQYDMPMGGQTITYSVSPASAGTIDANGHYTASQVGEATITASCSDKQASYVVVNTISANLALNKPSTAGHYETPIAEANDANLNSYWALGPNRPVYEMWWRVDLEETYDLSLVIIKWEGACPTEHAIQVSSDDANWTDVATKSGWPEIGGDNDHNYQFYPINAQGRYIRVKASALRDVGWGMKMYDFQAFGTVAASPTKSVSAAVNDPAMGTVTVKQNDAVVTEVATGSTVTFSATPQDGYVFVNWSNGETRATFDAVVNSNMNLTANFRALGNIYCNTEVTSTRDDDVHKAYATMKRTSANNYKLVVRSAETLGNFSNTTLQVNGSENLNLNNQGTLTDNNHMLTYEFTSTTPPSMTSGYMYLNVPGSKFTECWFTKLTNIEYEVPCDDENVPVESISLNYTETTIEIDNTKTLVVTFNPVYATDKTITWTTTNSSVASVDNGVVTANEIGTATITAKTSNGKTATCAVTVEAVTEKTCWGVGNAFTYQGNPVSYYYAITRNVDKTLTYTAEFSRDVAGLGIQVNVHNDGVYSPMSYDSGSKTATFTTTEKFNTGNSLHGFFYFEGNRTDYYYTIGDECAKPSVAVTGVTINHTSATLTIDETVTLTAEVVPANADDKEIVWDNSDPSVASFESSTGLVTALTVGTTTITAKSHADENIFATCVVTVSSALTPTTWYGYGTFTPQEGLTGFTYSITRNVDHSLTYTIVLDRDPVGFVGELNIKDDGVYSAMTYTPATHTATFTTDENYALDGDVLNKSFWWLKYNGGVDRVNFSYTVGDENDPLPQAVAVDEKKDNNAILTTYNGQTVIGVLGRSFTAGNLYTLVLPFDVDAAQTAEKLPGQLTKLNNSYLKDNGDLRINFVNASAVEAGVPYLYQPSAAVANPAFEGVEVSATLHPTEPADNYAKYYGIYAPMDGEALHALTNAYVLGQDQYLYAVSDLPENQTMKALRAYFVLNFPETTSGSPKRLAKVVFNENETETTTDIENLQTDNTCIKVIVNGQLQIIRDGKTYNAFGQLVK